MRLRNVLVGGFTAVIWLTADQAWAQLPSRSPFMPAQSEMLGTPVQNASLQYLGFMQTPEEGMKYRLYDTTKKVSGWVTLNERDATFGVLPKQFDPERKMLTVEFEGRTFALLERETKSGAGGGGVSARSPTSNPVTAVEAKLRTVFETTARDAEAQRAAREQATLATPANQPPARR